MLRSGQKDKSAEALFFFLPTADKGGRGKVFSPFGVTERLSEDKRAEALLGAKRPVSGQSVSFYREIYESIQFLSGAFFIDFLVLTYVQNGLILLTVI